MIVVLIVVLIVLIVVLVAIVLFVIHRKLSMRHRFASHAAAIRLLPLNNRIIQSSIYLDSASALILPASIAILTK